MLTAIDFFSGAGGFSLGFIQAGINVLAGFEISPEATHTYLSNLGSPPVQIHFTSIKYQKVLTEYFEKVYKRIKRHNEKVPVAGDGWIRHHPEAKGVSHFFFGDIREATGDWIKECLGVNEIDIVAGGPPCQGWSKANRNIDKYDPLKDLRNNLFFHYARIINELAPKTYVLEEVPNIVNFTFPDGSKPLDLFKKIANGEIDVS